MTKIDGKVDVAIIGAGVIGCSIAYYLCQRGISNTILIEKESLPGCGSTSKANGGIRAQFSTEPNIRMSLLSMNLLDALDDEMRSQSGYVKAGYLFVTARQDNWRQLQENIEYQQQLGVAVETISRTEIQSKFLYLRSDDLLGGSFGSRDGFIEPGGLANAFYSGAMRLGAKMLPNTQARGLLLADDRVTGVETDGGTIRADLVVNAAGAFASEVAAWAGVDLPVRPIRSNIAVSGPTPDLPQRIPMTIDLDTGLLVRREGQGCSFAWTNPNEPAGLRSQFDPEFIEHIAPKMEKRFPKLVEAGIDFAKCWAGLYPETPDHHAILAESGVSGFLLATGLGGHGIMHAPAVGFVISELIAKGRVETLDISPFNLKRFETGELNLEKAVL